MDGRGRDDGFWDRLEGVFHRLERDPEFASNVFRWLWIVSVGFVLFGFLVMAWVLLLGGDWPPF